MWHLPTNFKKVWNGHPLRREINFAEPWRTIMIVHVNVEDADRLLQGDLERFPYRIGPNSRTDSPVDEVILIRDWMIAMPNKNKSFYAQRRFD